MNGKTLGKMGPVAWTSTGFKSEVLRSVKRAEKAVWQREVAADRAPEAEVTDADFPDNPEDDTDWLNANLLSSVDLEPYREPVSYTTATGDHLAL